MRDPFLLQRRLISLHYRSKAVKRVRRDRLTHCRADSLRRLEWLRIAKASDGLLIHNLPTHS